MCKRICVFALILLGSYLTTQAQQQVHVLSVPAVTDYTHIDTAGKSVLASGRYVTPAGKTLQIAHDPFGIAVSPDGSKTVTLHNGIFTVIDNVSFHATMIGWIGDKPGNDARNFPSKLAYEKSIPSPLPDGSFLGVAFANNHTVYLSGGDNGSVIEYDIDQFKKLDSLSLNGTVDGITYGDSFTSDLVFDSINHELLVLDRANYRLVRINLATRQLTASIPTGRLPFGIALSPDRKLAFVANVGMYAYPLMPDITPDNYDSMLLPCILTETIPKNPSTGTTGTADKCPA